ncbi:MAG: hypothetical protein ACON5N_04195 [Akkermansiaceae bacterium]
MKAAGAIAVISLALVMMFTGRMTVSEISAWVRGNESVGEMEAAPSDRVLTHGRFVLEGKTVEELLAHFNELDELRDQEKLSYEESQVLRRKYTEGISEEVIQMLLGEEDLSSAWGLALSYQWGRLNPDESIGYFVERYRVVTTTESDQDWLPTQYASCLQEAIVGWIQVDPKSSWDVLKNREWELDHQIRGEDMEVLQLANYEIFKNLAAADHEFALAEIKATTRRNDLTLMLAGFGRGTPDEVD